MGIAKDKKLPQILIVDSSEMNLGVLASYNPVDDVLRIDSRLSIKEQIPILQKEGVFPDNETSTLIHELYHWQDAEKYKLKFGDITKDNVNNYFKWVDNKADHAIDKLEKTDYDIKSISEYARKSYKKRAFDEVYTEYRTLILLGCE